MLNMFSTQKATSTLLVSYRKVNFNCGSSTDHWGLIPEESSSLLRYVKMSSIKYNYNVAQNAFCIRWSLVCQRMKLSMQQETMSATRYKIKADLLYFKILWL